MRRCWWWINLACTATIAGVGLWGALTAALLVGSLWGEWSGYAVIAGIIAVAWLGIVAERRL